MPIPPVSEYASSLLRCDFESRAHGCTIFHILRTAAELDARVSGGWSFDRGGVHVCILERHCVTMGTHCLDAGGGAVWPDP